MQTWNVGRLLGPCKRSQTSGQASHGLDKAKGRMGDAMMPATYSLGQARAGKKTS